MKSHLKDQKVFKEFCTLNIDRKKIIVSILESEDIPYSIISLDSADHIVIFPRNLVNIDQSNVLLAHYDRVDGTPGANDNSASVFYLLYHAKRLKNENHSTIIIFTDREEIGNANSVTEQGSYSLGRYFKSKNIKNLNFYVFDMCGIGNTILLGTAGENLIKDHYKENYNNSIIKGKIERVKKQAEDVLLTVNCGEFFYLTPLFSDDLGLILNEYPAVLISLLPYREAVEYKNNPKTLPKSWQNNHTMDDNIDTLDFKSWDVLSELLLKLSGTWRQSKTDYKGNFYFNCYTQKLQITELEDNQLKPLLNYIDRELFNISSIETKNKDNLVEFLLFSSEIKEDTANFFKNKCGKDSADMTYNIYNYLKKRLQTDFNKLPLIIRNKINSRSKELGYSDNLSFLYENIIHYIGNAIVIDSKPLNKKVRLEIKISAIELTKYCIYLSQDNLEIGTIFLLKQKNGFIMDTGVFRPQPFLKLDPLNLLKGIRLVLIKWLKLNNNDSLRFNLSRSNWIGCDQFYRLVKMELDGKSHEPPKSNFVYIWKRYYGKQS